MFIRTVDEGLARLLRAKIPLPANVADVSFAPPTVHWAATISRPTVSLFLYEVKPSERPGQAIVRRLGPDGRSQRRLPSPVLEMNYLVSAWAADPLAEHQLLGEVINLLVAHPILPDECLPGDATSPVQLIFSGDENNPMRDIWRAAGGQQRASFTLSAVAAADSFPWTDEAPPVTEVLRGLSRRT